MMAGKEEELMDLGLPVAFYADLNGVFAAAWVAMGALVFWYRSYDRVALLVAFFLVTYGLIFFDPIAPEFLAKEYHSLELPVAVSKNAAASAVTAL